MDFPEPWTSLYPDVAAQGGLPAVLQAALPPGLLLIHPGWDPWSALARAGARTAEVGLSRRQPQLRVRLAGGDGDLEVLALPAALPSAAALVEAWVFQCRPAAAVASLCPGAQLLAWGQVAPDDVGGWRELCWAQLLHRLGDDRLGLAEVLELAGAHPRLRALFPHVQGATLGFSRCSEPPFTQDCPSAHARPGGPITVADATGAVRGTGPAPQALAWLLECLPRATASWRGGPADAPSP